MPEVTDVQTGGYAPNSFSQLGANPGTHRKVVVTVDGTFADLGSVADATAQKIQLSIGYLQLLTQLRSTGWFNMFSSGGQFGQIVNVQKGEVITYRPNRIVSSTYNVSNQMAVPAAAQVPGVTSFQTQVDLIKDIGLIMPSEELGRLGAVPQGSTYLLNEALVTAWQYNVQQAFQLYMEAKALSGVVKFLTDNSKITTVKLVRKKANDPMPDPDTARMYVWGTLFLKVCQLKQKFTQSSVGTDTVALFIEPEIYGYLVQATMLYSDSSRRALLDPIAMMAEIAGLKVIQVNFLGIQTQASWVMKNKVNTVDKDEAFDFRSVNAILAPARLSGLMPVGVYNDISTVVLQGNKNIWTYMKFGVPKAGALVVLPEFTLGYKFNLADAVEGEPDFEPDQLKRFVAAFTKIANLVLAGKGISDAAAQSIASDFTLKHRDGRVGKVDGGDVKKMAAGVKISNATLPPLRK